MDADYIELPKDINPILLIGDVLDCLKKIGWLLRNQIVWYKSNHMPSPAKTRFTNTYELIYFFTRDDWEKRVWFDMDSVRIPYKNGNEEVNYNGFPRYLSVKAYKKMLPMIKKYNKAMEYK